MTKNLQPPEMCSCPTLYSFLLFTFSFAFSAFSCLFFLLQPPIIFLSFARLQASYDKLTIAGVAYSGATIPSLIPVTAGAVITWAPDSTTSFSGWQVPRMPQTSPIPSLTPIRLPI